MSDIKLKQGTKVSYNTGNVSGTGTIKGIASLGQPWIGCLYIVESESIFSETYPYTSFSCPETFLTII